MKKNIHLSLVLTLFCLSSFAQQRVSVQLANRPLAELFDAIEQQTNYRIYCTAEVSDSMKISVDETNAEPLALIRKTLQNTDFQLSEFQNAIYESLYGTDIFKKERYIINNICNTYYQNNRSEVVSLLYKMKILK